MKKFNVTPNETPQLLEEIQGNADYHFKNTALLMEAFTHPSYASEQKEPPPHNQRLEFLGDAVLQIIASDHIFKTFKDVNEGLLTKIRSNITDEAANVSYTRKLQLDLALLLGKGEAAAGGRSKPSTLGDLFEDPSKTTRKASSRTTARKSSTRTSTMNWPNPPVLCTIRLSFPSPF